MMAMRRALEAIPTQSLWDLAAKEAHAHKWLLSERSGYDVGKTGLEDWYRRHFPSFCRHRRADHLQGRSRIREFDQRSFGLMWDPELAAEPVMRFVLDRFIAGWENLHFYFGDADRHFGRDPLNGALALIDVNCARFDRPAF